MAIAQWDIEVIKQKYPKSLAAFRQWMYQKHLQDAQGEGFSPEEQKAFLQKLDQYVNDVQYVDAVLKYAYNHLMEFFDDQEIFLSINYHLDLGRFTATDSVTKHSTSHTSRPLAEQEGLVGCLEVLEKRLSI
jgi:hypothetical protein